MQKMTERPSLMAAAVCAMEPKSAPQGGGIAKARSGDERRTHLGGDELIGLVEDGATLRVSEDNPLEVDILELGEAAKERVRARSIGQRAEGRKCER